MDVRRLVTAARLALTVGLIVADAYGSTLARVILFGLLVVGAELQSAVLVRYVEDDHVWSRLARLVEEKHSEPH